MKTHAGIGRVDLQIEGGGLGGFLLVAGESGEAVGEGVGDAEVHRFVRSPRQVESQFSPGMMRFMNSSNRGTVKPVSPWLGLQIMPLEIN